METSALKVYFATPNNDPSKTKEVHQFLNYVKEKGEISIIPLGPFSDDPEIGMAFIRDSLNMADVVVLAPTTLCNESRGTGSISSQIDNEHLYFVAGVAFGFGIPIVGIGPEFCEFSFMAPKGEELFENSKQIYPVYRVFENNLDNYEILLQTIVKAANECVTVETSKIDENDKVAFHVEQVREVSETQYRAYKAKLRAKK